MLKRQAREYHDITLVGPPPAAANASALRAEAEALLAQPAPELRASVAARVSVLHASMVAARDFEAGTLVMPVAGCCSTPREVAGLLQRASAGMQRNNYVFPTSLTRAATLRMELVVGAAPALNLVNVASRGFVLPGNIAIVAAIGAGRCGSFVVKSVNGDYVNSVSNSNLLVPLLLCVATRPIKTGDALLFDADTEFWKSTPAGDASAATMQPSREHELPDEQLEVCEHDPNMGSHVGNQSPGFGAGTVIAASDVCPPAPLKRPRDAAAADGAARHVRACCAAQAGAARRAAPAMPALTETQMVAQASRMVTRFLGPKPACACGGVVAQRRAGHACQY